MQLSSGYSTVAGNLHRDMEDGEMDKIIERRGIHLSCHLMALVLLLLSGGQVASTFASDLGLSQADCRCCHGATLADRHHLLVNTSGRECLSCHPLTFNSATQSYDLTVTRDCLQCHTGSLADRHHLLVDQVTYDCFTCHALVWDPVTLQYLTDFNKVCQSSTPPSPAGVVAGSVTNQGGAALGWVRIATTDGAYSTLATATGSYEMPSITPGNYTLVASLDGYADTSQNVTIADGQTLSLDFVLSPLPLPATVSGIVHDVNQMPVEGATIVSADNILTTFSLGDGSYTLGNIAEGDHELIALKPGYGEASQTLSVTAGQNLTQDFILPASLEICDDTIDNDGNSLSDCDDPACIGNSNCQATEICGDGLDNDNNNLSDCDDPVCIGTSSCEIPVAEICNDNFDNNGDGLLDCNDPLCNTSIYCLTEQCDDSIDNNGDGLIDCDDEDCSETSLCQPPPVEICDDGLDNDGNGLLDCDDNKCANLATCVPPVAGEICNNNIDDNGDGHIDCADELCRSRAICLDEICDNGLDDDADGRVDCEDMECRQIQACDNYTGDISLDFTATAKRQRSDYEAAYVGDKDMSTRWWSKKSDRQWLKLDLGGAYPIDKVDIHWHSLYAKKYKIMVSKNGRYWKTAKVVRDSDGGLDSNTFETSDVRYVLIKCRRPATSGYSIYEVEVFRSETDDE
jgi:hypothetical protein